ncbi:MAG: hypothetical protein ABI833_11625 [Acidobacteriota bacterium]
MLLKKRGKGKSAELARWLEEHHPAAIGPVEFTELRAALAPISESYLRKLLRECGVPLQPMVEGARQGSFAELEVSLLRLLEEYQSGDPAHRMAVRRLVIIAKEHARLAARNPDKRRDKEEMILWLTTWLENPPVFEEWVKIRRRRTEDQQA